MKIIREHTIEESYRVASIRGQFDFNNTKTVNEWDVDIDLPDDWQIGVIVGPSGSGKTTIGKEYFGEDSYFNGYQWSGKSVVDDFPEQLDAKQITTALSSVGFSSPPSWLQPFYTLSNGQKFRVEMARILFDDRDTIVVDEFTSVVDRQVAQIGSYAIQKYIRKNVKDKKIVLLSCHYDVLEWLQPDWVYDVSTGKTTRGCLWQRPEIKIDFYRCDRQMWDIFRKYHYLDHNISPAAQCFVGLINGIPAVFGSYIHSFGRKRKNAHRIVVMPDYQGIGLGNIISEKMGEYCLEHDGMPMSIITSHPALIHYFSRSNKWSRTRMGHNLGKQKYSNDREAEHSRSALRITASFVYVGDRGFEYLKGWKNG